jgi:hypothetical protein
MLQTVLDKSTSQLMEMQQLLINPKYKKLWGKSYTKELARLLQFIKRKEIPADRCCDTTYARVCVNYRPKKDVPNRM